MEEFDKEKMEELMIDYIEGNLSGELKEYVEKYIAKNEEAHREFELLQKLYAVMSNSPDFTPDSSLKFEFEKALEEEMTGDKSKEVRIISINWKWPMRIAAGLAILVVGYFLGMQFNNNNDELSKLRKEMEATKQLVMLSLQNQSASQRIMGVNYTETITHPDDQILDVLIKTMNHDENTNVRLAAVNALMKFSSEEKVRLALINSLDIQTDPIIQIALIDAMVNLKETRAIDKLKSITEDEKNLQVVQDQAHYGLFKLM